MKHILYLYKLTQINQWKYLIYETLKLSEQRANKTNQNVGIGMSLQTTVDQENCQKWAI